MKVKIGFLAVLVVVAITSCGCVNESKPPALTLASFTTDQNLYHSKDPMVVTVTLNATGDMQDVYLNISGIINERGKIMVYNETVTNLTAGVNRIIFKERMPSCNRCSKLSEGTYYLNLTVVYQNTTLINATTPGASIPVELRQ